jgi:glyoxylase-like metal-dependent hydrolase (beta-lactamase superfamily II)
MRLHHLNCVSTCPLGGRLMDGRSGGIWQRGRLCCHCILAETDGGLVLVDTGFGLHDVRAPSARLSRFFLGLVSPDFREEMTAVRQIERLGWKADDVRHIVLTHLDFDHAGGLDDFPSARVHLMRTEQDAAARQATWLDRQRFRPEQWSSRPRWEVYDTASGEDWHGFERATPLRGLPPDIALVPLAGHTLGHAGVAIDTGQGWLLQAGDAYFFHREMDLSTPWCTPGLRLYQTLMEKDRRVRLENQQRLRELRANAADVQVVCAHDPFDFERVARRTADLPVPAISVPARPAR